jgi:hypothetical protein
MPIHGLKIADWRFTDWRMAIGAHSSGAACDLRSNHQSSICNPNRQSSIPILNRQSAIRSICSLQSPIANISALVHHHGARWPGRWTGRLTGANVRPARIVTARVRVTTGAVEQPGLGLPGHRRTDAESHCRVPRRGSGRPESRSAARACHAAPRCPRGCGQVPRRVERCRPGQRHDPLDDGRSTVRTCADRESWGRTARSTAVAHRARFFRGARRPRCPRRAARCVARDPQAPCADRSRPARAGPRNRLARCNLPPVFPAARRVVRRPPNPALPDTAWAPASC